MRIAVLGAGSLGTIVGALLSRAGLDVVLVDVNVEHVNALNSEGARVEGQMEFITPVKAITPDQMDGTYDLIIYLVKTTCDETALPEALGFLSESSMLLTLQNGLPEEKVASFVGAKRTLGGAVGWTATWLRPGVSELNSLPDTMSFDIGELDGAVTERVKRVKEVLDNAGQAEITSNLPGIRWTKMMINVAQSALSAVCNCTHGEILDDDTAITAGICIALEALRTARALGIELEPIQGVDPNILEDLVREDLENAKNALRMILAPAREGIPSMLQDLRKGLPCEVETLNGYLSRISSEAGVPTPVNDQVTEMIRRIQAGDLEYGFDNLPRIELPDISIYLSD
jgi:2-dehydropantoate 2-reductase